jgi:preprotein translocase subunit SecY
VSLRGVEQASRTPELRTKLFWTFGILAAYRVGVHVPVPGVDVPALQEFFAAAAGTLFGLFDMFSGGGLSNVSIFALGIMPYISASIILQLMQVVSPTIKRLAKEEGAAGRKKLTQYTRYLTVFITVIQGFGITAALVNMSSPTGSPIVLDPSWTFRLVTILTLTAGTILIMWLGEQITEKGIGNGISLVIFSGIVASIPGGILRTFQLMGTGDITIFLFILIVIVITAVLLGVVFVERGQRRIPIHYAKRLMGRKMVGGQTTHLPLKVNTAGVIPPIFASSLLMFPATIAPMFNLPWMQNFSNLFDPTTTLYNVLFVALISFFCFFYTAIVFDPKDIADNLKNQGGFVPGIRPGGKTKEYIDRVLTRITFWGAIYISIVCVLPQIMVSQLHVPFYFGGTSILIMVGVAMDFMGRVESYLISRQYEGLMNKTRLKGRT